ncbi:MAG TPA: phosphatidylglycerophosphatase A [Ignavibacteria bacterium]|nr:phosphatidylglycerophosphatase A [Ignavibacteria bacterium]
MTKINLIEKAIGSGLFTGFIPLAPGTFGSLVGLLIYLIPGFEEPLILIPAIIIFTFYGIFLGSKFEQAYGKDPGQCTIDEVIGMWITLLFLPKTLMILIIAFFVWRAFDIIKPYPIRKLEAIEGGLGIMIDDVLGGIYSLITMQLILVFIIK